MKRPFSYAIWADDVRQEANGKLLYIGVYNGILYGEFDPKQGKRELVLPNFVCSAHLSLPIDKLPSTIQFKIVGLDDEQLATGDGTLDPAAIAAASASGSETDYSPTWLTFSALFRFTPLRLNKSGRVRLETRVDNRVLRCPPLRIVMRDKRVGSDPATHLLLGAQKSSLDAEAL
jgi:hypothetical protein